MTILPTNTEIIKPPTEDQTATNGIMKADILESERVLCQILNSLKEKEKSDYTFFLNNETDEVHITIPKEALSLLVEILVQMGKGNGVKIVPIRKELTTTEAADILNVSRPYLVELLDSGQIPFRSIESRRRILLEDVMNYKNNIDAKREQTLAELAAQAQELNMGY
jgi:excisionase family DNA binding protein